MRSITIILCFFLLTSIGSSSAAKEPLSDAQIARQQANCAQWPQAIESYNKALTKTPRDVVCLARRGFAYAHVGDFERAFSDFNSALKCDTNCPDAYSGRSSVYSKLGLKQLAKKDTETALALITSIPKEPDRLIEHAKLLYNVGKKSEADKECKQVLATCSEGRDLSSLLSAFLAHSFLKQQKDAKNCINQAIKLEPNCIYLYLERSWAYSHSNEFALAIADLNRYIKSNQKDPLAFWSRAYCQYNQRNYSEAVSDYDRAIILAPNFAYAYYWRGMAFHSSEVHQKAIDDFSTAINLESTDEFSYKERAHLYGYHQKQWAKSLKDTQRAISLNPKYAEAYVVQAFARDHLGQSSKAISDYDKAVALTPKDPSVYYERGMNYRNHGLYKKAIADITEAIKYDPTDAIKFCARGSALVSDHQYKRAIADCTQSLKLNSKRTHPLLSRGIAYAKLGQHKLALQDFDEIIRHVPKYGEAYYERSFVYKEMGKNDLSKIDLQKANEFGHGSTEAM